MPYPRDEIEATIERYVETRKVIDAGGAGWSALAQYFTDDAVFIDPAWGRVEGIDEMKATVFGDAMVGLEEWKFPVDFYMIDGDLVVIKWTQLLPGKRADGRPYAQSGVSTLVYAGNGKFKYEEDLLNMVHVFEDMKESKCKVPDVAIPPDTRTATSPVPVPDVSDDRTPENEARQDTIDYIAITRLQNAYADTVTRRAWPEFHEMFLADAPVRVDTVTNPVIALTGPQQVGDFIGGAVERFEFFEFVPLSTRVALRARREIPTARPRAYICELRQDAASGHFTQAFGVYQDEYRRVDGRWWFARRDYQSLARSGRGEVFAFPADAFGLSGGLAGEQ